MADKKISTRQMLIDVSTQLMMAKGYNATKIEEVCQAAEVTKGAFFYYFKTKEELGTSVLQSYWKTRQNQFAGSDWHAGDTPLQQLQMFLAVVAEVFMHDPNGVTCLAGSFTQELAQINPIFREQVSALFVEWAEQIKPVLQAARDQAPSKNAIDTDALADHIVIVIEGALILAQAQQNPQIIARQLNMLYTHLELVFTT